MDRRESSKTDRRAGEHEPSHVATETIHTNEQFSVQRCTYRNPDCHDVERFQVETSDSVIVVAQTDQELVVVNQFRPQFSSWVLEFPGGGIEGAETASEAAKREFHEETGYRAASAEVLASYYVSVWEPAERYVVWMEDLTGPEDVDETNQEEELIRQVDTCSVSEIFQQSSEYQWVHTPIFVACRAGKLSVDAVDR